MVDCSGELLPYGCQENWMDVFIKPAKVKLKDLVTFPQKTSFSEIIKQPVCMHREYICHQNKVMYACK